MKNHVPCLSPNCPTEYSVGTIKVVFALRKKWILCHFWFLIFRGFSKNQCFFGSKRGAKLRKLLQQALKVFLELVITIPSWIWFVLPFFLGLESCPFCDYCEVPNENDSLFQCKFPECLQISCRQCREPNHLPLRCEEFAMKQRLNNYVETKMTEALLRQCPSCKKNFVKADGCNKMVRWNTMSMFQNTQ